MKNDLIAAVQAYVDTGVPARSVPFEWDGKRYWIKISLPCQRTVWHRVQDCFAFLSRAEVLRSTVSSFDQVGLDEEAKRLIRIKARHVLVPDVVAQKPGWLLLSDIGTSLHDALENAEEKEPLLMKAMVALADLHQKGGWHGTGQLRDMIISPAGEVGFIDFEEAVGEAMGRDAAQARDVLRFLISAVRFDREDGALLQQLLARYQANGPQTVWPQMKAVLRLISPLAFILRPFYNKLGRDVRETLLVYQALKQTVRQP
ncbi:MAG: hypothetical protein HWE30_15430 [Methylocystaceae bacterium]|nr:hypothetical protein [Methylocystaceae bacterium]